MELAKQVSAIRTEITSKIAARKQEELRRVHARPIKLKPEEIALDFQAERYRREGDPGNLHMAAIDRFWRAKGEAEFKRRGYSRKQVDNIWAGIPTSMEEQRKEREDAQVATELPTILKTDELAEQKSMDHSITSIPMTPEWRKLIS